MRNSCCLEAALWWSGSAVKDLSNIDGRDLKRSPITYATADYAHLVSICYGAKFKLYSIIGALWHFFNDSELTAALTVLKSVEEPECHVSAICSGNIKRIVPITWTVASNAAED